MIVGTNYKNNARGSSQCYSVYSLLGYMSHQTSSNKDEKFSVNIKTYWCNVCSDIMYVMYTDIMYAGTLKAD